MLIWNPGYVKVQQVLFPLKRGKFIPKLTAALHLMKVPSFSFECDSKQRSLRDGVAVGRVRFQKGPTRSNNILLRSSRWLASPPSSPLLSPLRSRYHRLTLWAHLVLCEPIRASPLSGRGYPSRHCSSGKVSKGLAKTRCCSELRW